MAILLATKGSTAATHAPEGALRWDIAWSLFLPGREGDVPSGYPEMVLGRLTAWAWDALGDVGGRMRVDKADPIWFIVPPLTPAAEEYVVRLASFWDDDVRWASDAGRPAGPNLWLAPVADIVGGPGQGALDAAVQGSEAYGPGRNRVIFPQIGFGRLHVMVVEVAPGGASDRLHSHTADDEYYYILSGKATLRVGAHVVPVEAGMLIGKPAGPDLPSQILADRGEPVTILDLEAWPDARRDTKDFMYYVDFGEIHLHGSGGNALIPDAALYPTADKRGHHNAGYHRNLDGTWTPRDIPGAPARVRD
jgi:uncharacterized cupin superfamily protein